MYYLFESYVILDTTKTSKHWTNTSTRFESYVILDTTKTITTNKQKRKVFESYVILDTTKTEIKERMYESKFESYIILDTTKTMTINVEGWLRREDKKLRIISVFLLYSSFSPFKFVLEFLALTIQEKLIAKNRLTKKL